jgi:toxin CptA
MSIAVSAVIYPSRLLRAALALFGLASACAAVTLALWQPGRFHAPWLLAGACLAAALLSWRGAMESGNARRIDISGPGEIRLSVQQSLGAAPSQSGVLQLLPGSTVWPSLMILLLRDRASGVATVAAILPDCVSSDQFRKIAVAISDIARRDNKFSGKNKIL